VTWLIKLYPPAWRRRYGRELADLIATQPASFGTAIDLIAGAVDAWLNPQSSTASAAADPKGAESMVSRMLQLRCAGEGPNVTAADHRKAAAVTIGGSLALVVLLMWGIVRYGKDPYLMSFMTVSWLVPYLFSQRYTTLKGRSGRAQAVLIGGPAAFVIAIALAAVWLTKN
jgi:hypothetical protein